METTKKKEYGMPERQRLLCSWTMELAAYLQKEHDMERKAAMELAHLNRGRSTHTCVRRATRRPTNGLRRCLPTGTWTKRRSARGRHRDWSRLRQ